MPPKVDATKVRPELILPIRRFDAVHKLVDQRGPHAVAAVVNPGGLEREIEFVWRKRVRRVRDCECHSAVRSGPTGSAEVIYTSCTVEWHHFWEKRVEVAGAGGGREGKGT